MNAISIENTPATWDDSRDVTFFAITARLFSTDFAYGAGVLLATYDVEDDFTPSADITVHVMTNDNATPRPSSSEVVLHSEPWSAA